MERRNLTQQQILELKAEKVRVLEEKLRLQEGLPHKYGLKLYPWQRSYKNNKFNPKRLVCAANQIGKSTAQIIDRIDIATTPELWPKLWPAQFAVDPKVKPYSWYLYPNQDTVMTEFREKWEPKYMPRNEFKDHEIYGWKEFVHNKVLKYVQFNSGYKIYFKTYNQNVQDLQSGTVFAIDCDEELPLGLLPELQARLFATDGHFSMAFTATIGQDFWYNVIERIGERDEKWVEAFKLQISMYDCLEYEDGTKTQWTIDRIANVIKNCKSKAEADRRVRGRFVKDSGLKYPSFTRERNLKPFPVDANGRPFKGVPKGWSVYSAVDSGSGGESGHPAAYSFLRTDEALTKIRWFRGKRLDGIETTNGDIFKFYIRDANKLEISKEVYDYASKDFGTIATRAGRPFDKAQKDHELGEQILDTAFKLGVFVIYYDPDDPDCAGLKLARELETVTVNADKRHTLDDLIDTVRYAIVEIPIDWDKLLNKQEGKEEDKPKDGTPEKERPNDYAWSSKEEQQEEIDHYQEEFDEWSELLGDSGDY